MKIRLFPSRRTTWKGANILRAFGNVIYYIKIFYGFQIKF